MKKICLLSLIFLFAITASAQEDSSTEPVDGWTKDGKIQLLFNQSAFNKEWTGGGTSSIAGNLILDYKEHYRKGNFTWDNSLLATYGLTKLKGDDYTRKTSDRFELNSIAGLQIKESEWYYSFFGNFRTQLTKGYEFSDDPNTGETIRTQTTSFLSPAYLQFGPGMMWKKNDKLFVNIAPATTRFIFVDKKFTSTPGYVDGAYFGVDEGEASRFELGASLNTYAKFEIVKNVSLANTLSLYSNYLDKPGNIDIDYLLDLNMTVNKYISANLLFQAIYDDNAIGAFQIREVFGAGFNFMF